jgi:hypothetical protein
MSTHGGMGQPSAKNLGTHGVVGIEEGRDEGPGSGAGTGVSGPGVFGGSGSGGGDGAGSGPGSGGAGELPRRAWRAGRAGALGGSERGPVARGAGVDGDRAPEVGGGMGHRAT